MEINKLTIIAGIIQLDNKPLPKSHTEAFIKHFSLKLNKQFHTLFDNGRSIHLFHDINNSSTPEITENEKFITAINGDTLLGDDSLEQSHLINKQIETETLDSILKSARGVFSGITINKLSSETLLYTDKLGIRPIYIYKKDGLLIYSSLLKLIEALPFVCLEGSKKGLNELLSIGFCLGNRTQYKYISRLDQSEHLSISDNNITFHKYWDWTSVKNLEQTSQSDIKELHSTFQEAVKIRFKQSRSAIAFLSGGLDSRSIVASLKELTDNIHTFNFGTKQAQDNVFAKLFAKEINTTHHEKFFKTLSFPNWSQLISNSINEDLSNIPKKEVWSGDGGSVGLGYVYIDEELTNLLLNGNASEACKLFITKNKIEPPVSILKKQHQNESKQCLQESIVSELKTYLCTSEKAMYFFLLFNDQKRHLDKHFETIHEHKVELILPFFDSEFIEKIISIPCHDMLYHKLYMRWFNLLPQYARNTPWQTYPKHEPCPIKIQDDLKYQWYGKRKSVNTMQDFIIYLGIDNETGVKRYFNKPKLTVMMLLHLIKVKDFTYIVKKLAYLTK